MRARNFPQDKFCSALDAALVTIKDERTDIASHYILRAAYCRTEDLRRWFLQQEAALFRHRLMSASGKDSTILSSLLNKSVKGSSGGPSLYTRVSDVEKQTLSEKLIAASSSSGKTVSLAEFRDESYYKIPFSQALDLVSSRQIFVSKGFAYVPTLKLVSTIVARFRSNISGIQRR